MVFFNDVTSIELVPEDSVIEISRILEHMCGKFFLSQYAVIVDISFLGNSFSYNSVEIRDDHITMIALCFFDKQSGGVRSDPVIAVEKLQVSAACKIQRHIPGFGNSGIFFMYQTDSGIFSSITVTDRS